MGSMVQQWKALLENRIRTWWNYGSPSEPVERAAQEPAENVHTETAVVKEATIVKSTPVTVAAAKAGIGSIVMGNSNSAIHEVADDLPGVHFNRARKFYEVRFGDKFVGVFADRDLAIAAANKFSLQRWGVRVCP
ncbi:MAG: hypothetical protein WBR26_27770 [Candidatus Acidiferrum sp.]